MEQKTASGKAFLWLVVAVVALGGALGGAFAGGVAVGNDGGDGASATVPLTDISGTGAAADSDISQLFEQFQSGELDPEAFAELREQFGGQFGQDGFGGLSGPIESIDGSTITVTTLQGPLQAEVTSETVIRLFTEGSLEDLVEGMQVTVVGQRGDDGTVQADSITMAPEGQEGFGGTFFQGRPRR